MQTDSWSAETKKLVFATVAKNLKPADQALFEAVCKSSGLDPLRKEIYAVSRGGSMSIQTGIDGYLKLANQTKELNGMDVLFYDEDGVESEVWLKKTPPAACLVRVYRKNCEHPFAASCRFEAYCQKNQMWSKFPETMLAKCATTLALRRAFADVISGIASADEMDQAGMAAEEAIEITQRAGQVEVQQEKTVTEAPQRRAATKKEVEQSGPQEAEAKKSEGPLEMIEGLTGAVAALRKKAVMVGLTSMGWETLEKQCGGAIDATKAAKALPALSDKSKVANLNAQLSTQGTALS